MRTVIILIATAILVVGCASDGLEQRADGVPLYRSNNAMKVHVDGGDGFPPELVGKWRNDKQGWELNFEPDGSLSSVVKSLGRIRLFPGKIVEVPMKGGGKAVFKPGQWEIYYNYDSKEVAVTLITKHFHMDIGKTYLDGSDKDIFVGSLLEDRTTMDVYWESYPMYIAHFPDKPDFDMSIKPGHPQEYDLVFKKVQPEDSE